MSEDEQLQMAVEASLVDASLVAYDASLMDEARAAVRRREQQQAQADAELPSPLMALSWMLTLCADTSTSCHAISK